jgi:hypothetical protein
MGESPIGPDRVWFRDSQLLAARDLADDADHESWMRALHVRAMHDTWGVATGFALAVEETQRGVKVGPGVAYDCRGHDIVVADELRLAAPQPPAAATLPGLVQGLEVQLVCAYGGRGLRRDGLGCAEESIVESAVLRWVFPPGVAPGRDTIRLGEDVPLGTFGLSKDGKLSGPYLGTRRNARARLRPRVGSGEASLPNMYMLKHIVRAREKVDTSAAEFTTTPRYFAWLSSDEAIKPGVLGPFVSIAEPTPTSFSVDLIFGLPMVQGPIPYAPVPLGDASLLWVGLEPYTGCPPTISFTMMQAILDLIELFA